MALFVPLLMGATTIAGIAGLAVLPGLMWTAAIPVAAKVVIQTAMAMMLYDWTISSDRDMTVIEGAAIFGGVLVFRRVV